MPRYEYRCPDCGGAFEVRMSMSEYSEAEKPACPKCGSKNVERSFGSIGVLTGSRGGSSGSSGGFSGGGGCGHSGFS